VLASERVTETAHVGTGGSHTVTAVGEDGSAWREIAANGERTTLRCSRIEAGALAELVALVRAAREAGLRPRYDTSALPAPNANYARTQVVLLGAGSLLEVSVVGWADAPQQLVSVTEWLAAHVTGCHSASRPTRPSERSSGARARRAPWLAGPPAVRIWRT
jgi:hypothetical protein